MRQGQQMHSGEARHVKVNEQPSGEERSEVALGPTSPVPEGRSTGQLIIISAVTHGRWRFFGVGKSAREELPFKCKVAYDE